MADPILLIQGDTPNIRVTLTREDTGNVIDVSEATVYLHFRKKGATTVLFSATGNSTVAQAGNGIVDFSFTSVQMDIDPGKYEGEVEIVFDNGNRETVYEILEFLLRADFA